MEIEKEIFKKCSFDFLQLKNYGFKKIDNNYLFETTFNDNSFKAVITINSKGEIKGKVFDLENSDEFLPLKNKNNQGAFVSEIRENYKNLLMEIKNSCCVEKYFIYSQANRITNKIFEQYNAKPEFLWEKTPGSAVFRNSATKKWFLAILDINRNKIQESKDEIVEIALIKLKPEKIEKLTKQKNFYPAYHMNKKHWITIILDDSLSDDRILELVQESYNLILK